MNTKTKSNNAIQSSLKCDNEYKTKQTRIDKRYYEPQLMNAEIKGNKQYDNHIALIEHRFTTSRFMGLIKRLWLQNFVFKVKSNYNVKQNKNHGVTKIND